MVEKDLYFGLSQEQYEREERLYKELLGDLESDRPEPTISWYEPGDPDSDLLLIGGSSHLDFADGVAHHLGFEKTGEERARHPNGEVRVRVGANMRDKKVIIVSSPHGRDVDKHYQEICGLASAARNHWATYRGAFVVLPNFAYGRQERESFAEREAVFGPQMARRFEEEGVHSAMAMDMHSDAVAGAFKGPWERLYGAYFMSMYYQHMFPGVVPVIVGPDSGGLKRAKHYQGFLRSPLLVNADKFRVETGKGAGAVEMGELNGQVVDQDCVIPDDILSSGTTLEEVAKLLKGAKSVTAIATHGEFIKSGRARMMRCEHIDHVIVSDTLPQQEDILRVMGMDQKIHVAHMSGVFAKAIQIVLSGKSHTMKELYQMPFDHLHMV